MRVRFASSERTSFSVGRTRTFPQWRSRCCITQLINTGLERRGKGTDFELNTLFSSSANLRHLIQDTRRFLPCSQLIALQIRPSMSETDQGESLIRWQHIFRNPHQRAGS